LKSFKNLTLKDNLEMRFQIWEWKLLWQFVQHTKKWINESFSIDTNNSKIWSLFWPYLLTSFLFLASKNIIIWKRKLIPYLLKILAFKSLFFVWYQLVTLNKNYLELCLKPLLLGNAWLWQLINLLSGKHKRKRKRKHKHKRKHKRSGIADSQTCF
jgi:hypothetical protein